MNTLKEKTNKLSWHTEQRKVSDLIPNSENPRKMSEKQADNVARFINGINNPHVLCGDFNLLPESKTFKPLEEFGMKNLIKEFGITSTRSSYYEKPVRFADYTLVRDGIKVNEFKILPDEVSDHLAMYLDFE